MSKNKNRNKNKDNRKVQFVDICLRGPQGEILLAAGRKPAPSDKDDDSIYFTAPRADGSCAEMSMMLDEAEDYLETVQTLVSDVEARPFHGSIAADTRAGSSGGAIEISIDSPDDRTASVTLQGSGEPVQFDADREPLERFLFAVREGICEDMGDED